MSHHLNLDAIRRNLLTNCLIDKGTAVVVLVQDKGTSLEHQSSAPPGFEDHPAFQEKESPVTSGNLDILADLSDELRDARAKIEARAERIREMHESEILSMRSAEEREEIIQKLQAEIQTLKVQNQGLASNQALPGMERWKSEGWDEVVREIRKFSPGLFGSPHTNAVEDVLNWIRQSARLREIFNQGLAETTAQ